MCSCDFFRGASSWLASLAHGGAIDHSPAAASAKSLRAVGPSGLHMLNKHRLWRFESSLHLDM